MPQQKRLILIDVRRLLRTLSEAGALEVVRDTYTGPTLGLYSRLEALESALVKQLKEVDGIED